MDNNGVGSTPLADGVFCAVLADLWKMKHSYYRNFQELLTCLVFKNPLCQLVGVGELSGEGDLVCTVGTLLDELGAWHVCPVQGNLTMSWE